MPSCEGCNTAEAHLLDLGVKAMMTRKDTGETVHYWLAPRSSIYKTGYIMANSMGVIDRTYRGVLKAPVIPVATGAKGFAAGDRQFQIIAPDMGWIEEVPGVNAQEKTKSKLMASLKDVLAEALDGLAPIRKLATVFKGVK